MGSRRQILEVRGHPVGAGAPRHREPRPPAGLAITSSVGSTIGGMDLTYPPDAEEFRAEIRSWLEQKRLSRELLK